MRNIFRFTVIILSMFFAFGGIAAWEGWLDSKSYIAITGSIGSIASVLGLISIGLPRLSSRDFQNIDADIIEDLSKTVRRFKQYEEKLSAGKIEIDRIERERTELELLVRQASLKAFLEERLHYIALEVNDKIESDQRLSSLIEDYDISRKKISDLNVEISNNEKADLILAMIDDIKAHIPDRSSEIYFNIFGIRISARIISRELGDIARSYILFIQKMILR